MTELERCVNEMGFIGCNVNPDPSGGFWSGPPLWDRYWWPLWETMCELDVPAMIHVSASCNQNFHTTGSHYLGADTTAYMQALSRASCSDFPGLRWIIPHGGGAVPYHWGRFKGMAEDNGWDFEPRRAHLLRHLRLPPARHRPARRRRADGEHPVRIRDGRRRPRHRSRHRQLLRRHEALHRRTRRSTTRRQRQVFEHNILRVYPRLAAALVGTP